MPENYGFRTAVGGFHKGDVSAYITKTAAAHQAQVQELQQQIDALTEENEQLRMQRFLMQEHPMQEETPAEPAEVPEEVPVQEEPDRALQDQELAAYRRAEAAERLASQRARQLYIQMQSICDRSGTSLQTAERSAQDAITGIEAQLSALMESVSQLQTTLRDSAQELHTMGQTVPDPAEALE